MRDAIHKIKENVFHIYESIGVFCTLIVGSEYALLIDTGYGFGNLLYRVRQITDLPLKVINTHGHVDHIQGNKCFSEIMIHHEDIKLLKYHSGFLLKSMIYWKIRKGLKIEEKEQVRNFFKGSTYSIKEVRHGDLIDLGDHQVEVIHTPGHTRGSICLLDKKNRILISGDSISSHVWLFLKESSSMEEYINSLEKVIQQQDEFDHILSSHSTAAFKPTLLAKIKHCAQHIDPAKSILFDSGLAGKAMLYTEGFEEVQRRWGYKNYNEFIRHVSEIDPREIAEIEFTSLVYPKN